MPLKLEYFGKTDQGLVRTGNEDNLLVFPEKDLFVVCDGMGGHSAGEVASGTAVGSIAAAFEFDTGEISSDPLLDINENLPPQADLLVKAIRLANRRIYNRSNADPNLSGMGTTIAGAVFSDKTVSVAHVGDSRVYVYRHNELIPLTEDHSLVTEVQQASGGMGEEAASTLVNKHIITRALGIREVVEVDIRTEEIHSGDIYVICSDGLCGYSTDREIKEVIKESRGDVKKTTENLIRMANERGGSDNVTVITVKAVETEKQPKYNPQPVLTVPFESIATGEREDEWLDILAERARERREKGEKPLNSAAELAGGSSRAPMLITLLILAAVSVAVYFFFGDQF